MASYIYLVNDEEEIQVEAYRSSSCGITIEEENKLTEFIDYCFTHGLEIKAVSDQYLIDSDIKYHSLRIYKL